MCLSSVWKKKWATARHLEAQRADDPGPGTGGGTRGESVLRRHFRRRVPSEMKPSSCKAKGRRHQAKIRADLLAAFSHLSEDDVRSTSMGAGEGILLSARAQGHSVVDRGQKLRRLNIWGAVEQCTTTAPRRVTRASSSRATTPIPTRRSRGPTFSSCCGQVAPAASAVTLRPPDHGARRHRRSARHLRSAPSPPPPTQTPTTSRISLLHRGVVRKVHPAALVGHVLPHHRHDLGEAVET